MAHLSAGDLSADAQGSLFQNKLDSWEGAEAGGFGGSLADRSVQRLGDRTWSRSHGRARRFTLV
jgi:hypothetical protein